MARDENMIAALKRERAAYVARGDDDRVRQVDEQLARYGHSPQPAEADGPKGRTGSDGKQQTAADTGPQTPEQVETPAEAKKAAPARKTAAAAEKAAPPAKQE